MSERFGVVHQCRSLPDAQGHPLVRPEYRQAISTVNPARQSRFFSGYEAVGWSDDLFGHPAIPGRSTFVDGVVDRGSDAVSAFGNAHDNMASPAHRARNWAPSSTRCGARVRSTLSLSLAGSPSMPLITSVPRRPCTLREV